MRARALPAAGGTRGRAVTCPRQQQPLRPRHNRPPPNGPAAPAPRSQARVRPVAPPPPPLTARPGAAFVNRSPDLGVLCKPRHRRPVLATHRPGLVSFRREARAIRASLALLPHKEPRGVFPSPSAAPGTPRRPEASPSPAARPAGRHPSSLCRSPERGLQAFSLCSYKDTPWSHLCQRFLLSGNFKFSCSFA